MAGGELWGVWVQTVTNDTTPANMQKFGEIEDMAEAYRDGFAKDFCDGQTSPTPPRWPDDGMQLIYTYDRESAELLRDYLRQSVQERVAEGSLQQAPTWLADLAQAGLTAAAAQALAVEAIEEGALDLTAGQVQARLAAYVAATGDTTPTVAELLRWIEQQGE